MCLGQDDSADFRRMLRSGASDPDLDAAIKAAISRKPKGHDFIIDRDRRTPSVGRHMSVTARTNRRGLWYAFCDEA
jgi:cyclic pyranopterin phosphate synthase